jgi:hypothetical protein
MRVDVNEQQQWLRRCLRGRGASWGRCILHEPYYCTRCRVHDVGRVRWSD